MGLTKMSSTHEERMNLSGLIRRKAQEKGGDKAMNPAQIAREMKRHHNVGSATTVQSWVDAQAFPTGEPMKIALRSVLGISQQEWDEVIYGLTPQKKARQGVELAADIAVCSPEDFAMYVLPATMERAQSLIQESNQQIGSTEIQVGGEMAGE